MKIKRVNKKATHSGSDREKKNQYTKMFIDERNVKWKKYNNYIESNNRKIDIQRAPTCAVLRPQWAI